MHIFFKVEDFKNLDNQIKDWESHSITFIYISISFFLQLTIHSFFRFIPVSTRKASFFSLIKTLKNGEGVYSLNATCLTKRKKLQKILGIKACNFAYKIY